MAASILSGEIDAIASRLGEFKEMIIVRKYLFIFILLSLFLFILGCQEKNQDANLKNDEVSIDLICNQQVNTNECTDRTFNDLQSFQIFNTALASADKMSGILNYAAEYKLSIRFQDQTTKKFHLSLGTDRNMKGLLVDLENTNHGYEIPAAHANKLRDLINN